MAGMGIDDRNGGGDHAGVVGRPMSLHIKACDPDNPYGTVIAGFLTKELFPANLDNKGQLLDALTDAFVASGQIRQGPAPTPEVLVTIREAIRHWIDAGQSIKVLVPWGSRKADDSGVDVAELGAMRQLIALNERVKRYYGPGIHVNLGIEDMGGYFLWQDDSKSIVNSKAYVDQFARMVNILGYEWLEPVKESSIGDFVIFRKVADEMSDVLYQYLHRVNAGDPGSYIKEELLMAHELGWKGDVPQVMIDHYLRQYERYYPDLTANRRLRMLGRYLGQSFARYRTNTKIKYPSWDGKYVQINFPQTVPGIPEALAARRLYYRTLPMKMARTHLPAWRGRGHLSIASDGAVTSKLTTVFDRPADLQPLKVQLTDGRDTVTINADFVVEG